MTFHEPCLACALLPPEVECNDDTVIAAMKGLRYPVLATLKKDGIRALRLNGTLLSRRFKKIPNDSIRERSIIMPGGFDVELWNKSLNYVDVLSIVMSQSHPRSSEIEFHVIDWIDSCSYAERCYKIMCEMPALGPTVKFSPPVVCNNAQELFTFEQMCIEEAGEGICFRLPNSPYKQGRSTFKEQFLMKLTRWKYDEAEIVGFVEQQENGNPDSYNANGKMERSSHQSEMRGKGTLGAIVVRNTNGKEFPIGTGVGLTAKFRQQMWDDQDKFLGRTIRYKAKVCGEKLLPRQPIFSGFRDKKVD